MTICRLIFQFEELPTNTFFLHISKGVSFTDRLIWFKQYLILNIERYEHLIYSWNYGIELADLLQPFLLYSEIKRRTRTIDSLRG